jgi:hypothetical protein
MNLITNGHSALGVPGRSLINEALGLPVASIAYRVGELLAACYPQRAIIASDDYDFNVEHFAEAGHCVLTLSDTMHAEVHANWVPDQKYIQRTIKQGWLTIEWQGAHIEVLRMSWPSSCGDVTFRWLIAETQALADAFFSAVGTFNSDVGETIMVFQDGYWQKSRELYTAIKRSTFDNLVLGGTLKQDLYSDLATFFKAQAIYTQANIPWKRGIVLIGPPGNGKTHAVKALINALGQDCLYVKSFSAENSDDHRNIRAVFEQARETAPCILVMEDLDSLITEHNRSFFLNELDGFAANEGVVVIASTNHPEKLDPAIMARPSRFDRKYHFGLPSVDERRSYLELWSGALDPAMQPTATTIMELAGATEGFSFAYLKELLVSSTIRWVECQEAGAMDQIMPAQLAELRMQMESQ